MIYRLNEIKIAILLIILLLSNSLDNIDTSCILTLNIVRVDIQMHGYYVIVKNSHDAALAILICHSKIL